MSTNWRHLEIVIGVLQSIAGVLVLYYTVSVMFEHIQNFETFSEDYITYAYQTVFKQCILVSFIILPQLVGGILLVAHRKLGWALTLISCINYIVVLFIIGHDPYISVSHLWVINAIGLVLSLTIVALLSKQFIRAYKPSIVNWLFIPAISNLTFALFYIWP